MPIARYKDLCIDAVEPTRLATFWGGILDRTVEELDDGDAVLRGPTPRDTIWINRVPEPKSGKHRVHLDVHGASVDSALALGATVLDASSFRWTVLADPEGGEFCLFVRDAVPDERLYEVVVASRDPERIARWWHQVLGGELEGDGDCVALSDIPDAPFEYLVFAAVPEPRTTKNRIHLDLVCADVTALTDVGATLLRAAHGEVGWDVLADPEGNEFCRFDAP